MKKKILIGSALAMGIIVLAGCNGDISNNNPVPSKNSVSAPAPSENSAVPAPAPTAESQQTGDEINDEISDLDSQINSLDLDSDLGESNLSDSELGL